jgi:XTP/dITP diphosphohydrolase
MKKLLFASANAHKISEIAALVHDLDIQIVGLADLGVREEIVENGANLTENAVIKARFLYDRFGMNCFADDTGLEVEALAGAPGVYSARYAGLPKNDQKNVAKLLQALQTTEHRAAQFKTVIAYIEEGKVELFEGVVKGRITMQPRGLGGFGYDPVFEPYNSELTFAEMDAVSKNKISHRARAMQQFLAYLAGVH